MKDKLTLEQEMLAQATVAEGKQQNYCRMPLVQPKLFILIGQVGAGKSSVNRHTKRQQGIFSFSHLVAWRPKMEVSMAGIGNPDGRGDPQETGPISLFIENESPSCM